MATTRQRGTHYETQALAFLRRQGLQHISSNYQSRLGEIDLIMRDGNTLVFVEVRFRDTASHGGPISSIDRQKQKKIIATAKHYLCQARLFDKVDCRFDVVGISGAGSSSKLEWIRSAFP